IEGAGMTEGLNLCSSTKMQPIRDLVAKVAGTNTTVLVRGESGVGKEVVARALHRASPRAQKQFLKVNCAALPGELLESELFGHEKGAFTGAYRQKPGKFEAAEGGTLLLDEIGEMPLRLQAKLLHVLQDGERVEIPQDTVRVFLEYHWPGNIRELENAVKRIVVLGSARPVHQEILANLSRGAKFVTPAAAAAASVVNPDAVISLKEIAR